jgi:hypothetical protein
LPLKPVARAWRDVSGLEHGVTAGRPYTRLILKPTTASREADRVSIDARSPRAAFIPVSDFNGWPDGALARDIRRFAPRIVQSTECARGEDRLDPSNA